MARSASRPLRLLLRELAIYRRVLRHPRTPPRAKILLALALGYACLPFDLIPDWIPALGQLDDLLLVSVLVHFARRSIPSEVMAECHLPVPPPEAG